jgi:hypothetical protein
MISASPEGSTNDIVAPFGYISTLLGAATCADAGKQATNTINSPKSARRLKRHGSHPVLFGASPFKTLRHPLKTSLSVFKIDPPFRI